MKKRLIILFLFSILLISPFVLAQEESQIYSDFNRFVDGVRMFFTFEEGKKITLSLEIREKEVNSAIENIKKNNSEEANKNLENAFDKLMIIQEKVSSEVADNVTVSVNKIVDKIEESNLTEQLNRYVLEEKKTQLVAELVVEVEGKEGQTLTREVVKNETEGRNVVQVNVEGEEDGTATWEIVGKINGVENNISDWVVEHTYAEGTTAGGQGGVVIVGDENGVEVSNGDNSGNNGLTPEVKTYVEGDGTEKNESLPEPDLNQINPDLYDPDARAPGDTIDDPDGPDSYAEGTTADGENTLAE